MVRMILNSTLWHTTSRVSKKPHMLVDFSNSWVNYSYWDNGAPTHAEAQYIEDGRGFINLLGLIKTGTTGDVNVLGLPDNITPAKRSVYPISISGAVGAIDIVAANTASNANGSTYIRGRATNATFSSLSGVEISTWSEGWKGVTFGGIWTNYDTSTSTFQQAGYYKDEFGVVHLRGLVKSGSVPGIIFTLPAGYRPSSNIVFTVYTSTGEGEVEISTNGNVTANSGGNAFLSLGEIWFMSSTSPYLAEFKSLTLLNNWVTYSATYGTPSYWISPDGWVYLQGLIKSGTTTANTPLFTLPSILNFDADLVYPVRRSGGGGALDYDASAKQVIVRTASATYTSLSQVKIPLGVWGLT